MNKFKLDFIGIGAERAASSWLAACLREHPEICFSKRKELFFFNEYDPHFLKVKNLKYRRGIKWYQTHFCHCQPDYLKGEYSPTYLYCPQAAARIKNCFPEIKLIVCLRDPVKRAFSQYLHDKKIGVIRSLSFEQALKKHDSYVKKGLYYQHLSGYFRLFPKKNILVFLLEDIQKNPQIAIQKLYGFLGLKAIDFIPPSLHHCLNTASESRFPFLNYFLIQVEYWLKKRRLTVLLDFLEDSGIRKALFLLSYNFNCQPLAAYPKMELTTERSLRKTFRQDVQKLGKLIERDLSLWLKPL